MAFVVAHASKHRIKMIDESGKAEYEQRDPLDVSYLPLLGQQKEDEPGAEAPEEAPTPGDALEKFCTARGELDVIIDLVNNLGGGRHIDYEILSGKPRSANALVELAAGSMSRLGHKRAALADASERLRRGAEALKVAARVDNTFYEGIALLQRYWKICLNPPTSEFANAPFSVDISILAADTQLSDASASGEKTSSAPASTAAAAAGGGGNKATAVKLQGQQASKYTVPTMIALYKSPSGAVLMQLDPPALSVASKNKSESQPRVALGARAVHKMLLELQQQLLWQTVSSKLDTEATHAISSNNYTLNLAKKVLSAMATSSDVQVAAMRPLVLDHAISCKLPSASIALPPRPYVPPLSAMPLLPMLSTWLSHIFLRDHLRQHLEEQVHETLNLRVNWVPTTEPYASALQLHVTWPPPAVNLLLLIQNDSVEVEGIANAMDSTSRWARTGQVPMSKNEVLRVLSVVLAATHKRVVYRNR